jgi:hypothetical protein
MSKNKKYRNRQIGEATVLPDGSTESTYIREEVPAEESQPKLDFDGWYAMRGPRIPKHHHKEILRADFSARGLGQCETLADFDGALNQYGVKLS